MTDWIELLPKGRPFIKMQGAQNHFVIVDGRTSSFRPTKKEIRHICDSSEGVGAEQLIVVESCTSLSSAAYARIRIYNKDGAEAEACANGTRCAAFLLMQESQAQQLSLQVGERTLFCQMKDNNIHVSMGNILSDWQRIPLSTPGDTLHFQPDGCRKIDAVALNIGNPHIIVFVDKIEEVNMIELGQEIQNSNSLPNSANVGFTQVINDSLIKLQVWERPGLLTKACGSGACVATYAAIKRGFIESDWANVDMPGGRLKVNCSNRSNIVVSGPVEFCFSGHLTI